MPQRLGSIAWFHYLAEWDPDCLITYTFEDLPVSHTTSKTQV
jgi:hypothetical protein